MTRVAIGEYAAPQTLTRDKDAVQLSMKLGDQPPKAGVIRGVLVVTDQSGDSSNVVPMRKSPQASGAGGG